MTTEVEKKKEGNEVQHLSGVEVSRTAKGVFTGKIRVYDESIDVAYEQATRKFDKLMEYLDKKERGVSP